MMKKITLLLFLAMGINLMAQESFTIDYPGYDETIATANGLDNRGFRWQLNNNADYKENANSTWAIVNYSKLMNTDDLANINIYPDNGDYTMVLDSVLVIYILDNTQNSEVDFKMDVFQTSDIPVTSATNAIIPSASQVDPTNGLTALASYTLDTNDLVSSASTESHMFHTNLNIPTGERFSLYFEATTDTLNEFAMLANYNEDCDDAEMAKTSNLAFNSQCYGNFGGTQLIPQDGFWNFGTGTLECGRYYIQNWRVFPFVTVTVNSFVLETDIDYINTFYIDAGCNGETAQLSANYAGNDGAATISWTPTTGLSDATIKNPIATIGDTDVMYYVTVTDAMGSVLEDSVFVQSVALFTAGADFTQACNSTSNYAIDVTGYNVGATAVWSNGDNGNLTTSIPGTYQVTVTNTPGCTATDQVIVTVTDYQTPNFSYTNPVSQGQNNTFTNTTPNPSGWDFSWKVNGANAPNGDPFIYKPTSVGNVTVTILATKSDNASCVWEKSKEVSVVEYIISINEINLVSDLTIAPNPSSDFFTVNFEMANNNDADVSFISIDGKTIATQSFENATVVNATFETSKLASGLYIVQVKTNEGVTTRNIVVSKN